MMIIIIISYDDDDNHHHHHYVFFFVYKYQMGAGSKDLFQVAEVVYFSVEESGVY